MWCWHWKTIRKAGIEVWILTGDKKETAVNVSNACRHFSPNMEHLVMTDMGVGSKTRDG
jgi:magnesium-transporting ATPase (P-type)